MNASGGALAKHWAPEVAKTLHWHSTSSLSHPLRSLAIAARHCSTSFVVATAELMKKNARAILIQAITRVYLGVLLCYEFKMSHMSQNGNPCAMHPNPSGPCQGRHTTRLSQPHPHQQRPTEHLQGIFSKLTQTTLCCYRAGKIVCSLFVNTCKCGKSKKGAHQIGTMLIYLHPQASPNSFPQRNPAYSQARSANQGWCVAKTRRTLT